MRRHSASLAIREMQMKTVMRFTPSKMAIIIIMMMIMMMIIIKNGKWLSVVQDVEKLKPPHCWWEYKMVQLLWKTT